VVARVGIARIDRRGQRTNRCTTGPLPGASQALKRVDGAHHAFVVDDHVIGICDLRQLLSGHRTREKLLPCRPVRGKHRNPGAETHRSATEQNLTHGLAHGARDLHRFIRIHVPNHRSELVTAKPEHPRRQTERRLHQLRQTTKQRVTGLVAVQVVDSLEVVDIEDDHGKGLTRAGGTQEIIGERLVEVAVIVGSGNRVGDRLFAVVCALK